MKADLHCHSHYSDGKHSPQDLLDRARDRGITHLAITDHDCTTAMSTLDHEPEVTVIPGVEISSLWHDKEIHVVGLAIAADYPPLQSLLESQQQSRHLRMDKIDKLLQKLDIKGLGDYLATLPCEAPTRTHVADYLINAGICKNHQKAFRQFLGRRGRAYVAAQWCRLNEAISTINHSGGIAVLAHPGRYAIGKRQLDSLITEFSAAGGEALEASYGNIDPLQQKRLEALALDHRLYLSQGSDFHDAGAHWTDLGKFPALSSAVVKNAIWHHPRWQF